MQDNNHPVEIPLDNIKEQAIEYVHQSTGLSKLWIERIHDYQWRLYSEAIKDGKSIFVPRMFRVLVVSKQLLQVRNSVVKKLGVLKNRKIVLKKAMVNPDSNITRIKTYPDKIKQIQELIVKQRVEIRKVDNMIKKADYESGLAKVKRRFI